MKKYLIITALLLAPAQGFASQSSLIAMASELEMKVSESDLVPVKQQVARKEKDGSISIASKNPFADISPAAGKSAKLDFIYVDESLKAPQCDISFGKYKSTMKVTSNCPMDKASQVLIDYLNRILQGYHLVKNGGEDGK